MRNLIYWTGFTVIAVLAFILNYQLVSVSWWFVPVVFVGSFFVGSGYAFIANEVLDEMFDE